PDLLEGDVADEVFDVDAPVAERAPLLVRLRDLGVEGDDALEAGGDLEQSVVHLVAAVLAESALPGRKRLPSSFNTVIIAADRDRAAGSALCPGGRPVHSIAGPRDPWEGRW